MNRVPTFLVADDDPAVRLLVKRALQARFQGASVTVLPDSRRVLETAGELHPAVIFLDWVFPHGQSGPELCAELKRHPRTSDIPVVLMSGLRTDLPSRVKSLGQGADLHLAKPFTVEELAGYTRALLSRGRGAPGSLLKLGPLQLNHATRAVLWAGRRLKPLPPVLFELLWLLAEHSPRPVAVPELVRLVWRRPVRDVYVRVALDRLRSHLRSAPQLRIRTSPPRAYRLTLLPR